MNNKLWIGAVIITLFACTNEKKDKMQMVYPESKKVDVTDNYFGTIVADPYRWLENDTSVETTAWVKAQNKVTFDYLSKIPFRDSLKNRLTSIWNYEKMSVPFKKGGRYFFYKNDGLQNQSVLYVQDTPESEPRVLLDPNLLSEDGTVAIASLDISKDGKLLAYAISRGGSDWNEVYFRDIESGKDISDHLNWVKFSGLAWSGNGLYYSGYTPPEKGKELSQKNEYHKLYYHEIGKPQSSDKIIMENKELPLRMFYAGTTDDEHFLIVYEENAGSDGNALHVKDLTDPKSPFIHIVDSFNYQYGIVGNMDNILFVKTNDKAGKYKLLSLDLKSPDAKGWKEILPEQENVLESVSLCGGKLLVTYMKDAHSIAAIYNTDGVKEMDINLPGIGSVDAFSGDKDDTIAFYSYTSFNYPTTIFRFNVNTAESKEYFRPNIDFNPDDYEVKQVFYESTGGVKIPMFIAHKKGIKLDGNNPTLLYGYGGFNISLTPSFSTSRILWLENGGVYAMANLRGGGEYGEEWHRAGTKLNKQNVFDDFIAAAQYLIDQKYTNPSKLAAQGGSNGGLLVGAVINQRPDLFKVALPAVGVMDMLRFQKFTIGWNWINDYGCSDDSTEFHYIYKYSPLHNIQENIDYPATLVTTADHDDRVVPAHSFKYIATLQEKYKGENPVLIRIETQAGHGAGKPTAKIIEEAADIYSFTFYNMGVTPAFK